MSSRKQKGRTKMYNGRAEDALVQNVPMKVIVIYSRVSTLALGYIPLAHLLDDSHVLCTQVYNTYLC